MNKLWLIVLFLFLAACSDNGNKPYEAKRPENKQVDWCGFTWVKSEHRKPADVVYYKVVPDWRDRPGVCKQPKNYACTEYYQDWTGKLVATVMTEKPAAETMEAPGQCDPIMHETLHALGYDHVEAHSYTPGYPSK